MIIGSQEVWSKLNKLKAKHHTAAPKDADREKFFSYGIKDSIMDININDAIDSWFGIDAEELVNAIRGSDAEEINIRINSPGGDVFGGVAIYNALVESKAKVNVQVDALCASIATVVALAGSEKPKMMPMSRWMIHNAWTVAMGDHKDLRDTADILEGISDDLAALYAKQTGKDVSLIKTKMDSETWFNVAEAVDFGFAREDEVEGAPNTDEQAVARAKIGLKLLETKARALEFELDHQLK